jgi:hypothetical protein
VGKKNVPHRAILRVDLSMHTLMNTGECSARYIPKETLEKCGLQEVFLLYVDGKDQWDCLNKLQKKIKEFNNSNG